jgi:flagellar L-ring protein precursor FlgH
VPNGATVERSVPNAFAEQPFVMLNLNTPDFTTAARLTEGVNGLLQVRGQKWIAINQGKEYVRIQGYIRPIDIQPDNSIVSTKVANASISYGGKGPVASASAPGLLARFFNSKWMPF